MERKLDLIALGNALTDITIKVKDKDLKTLGIKKGGAVGWGSIDQDKFYNIINEKKQGIFQAGSPSNVIFNASKLGLATGLIGCVSYDSAGDIYKRKLKANNIKNFFNFVTGQSGTCYILVTPDGERTNIADLGVSGNFDPDYNKLSRFDIGLFHTSGYELSSNPEKTMELFDYMTERRIGTSFDLAANSIIRKNKYNIEKIIRKTSILFATEEEAREFTDLPPFKALDELAKMCPIVSLKRGKKGSVVKYGGKYKTPIYETKLINACGAGDAYAAGFLFSYLQGFHPKEWGKFGNFIASRVCNTERSNLLT